MAFLKERKQKHHNISVLHKLTPPSSAVWNVSSAYRRKAKSGSRIQASKSKGNYFFSSLFWKENASNLGGRSLEMRQWCRSIFSGDFSLKPTSVLSGDEVQRGPQHRGLSGTQGRIRVTSSREYLCTKMVFKNHYHLSSSTNYIHLRIQRCRWK